MNSAQKAIVSVPLDVWVQGDEYYGYLLGYIAIPFLKKGK